MNKNIAVYIVDHEDRLLYANQTLRSLFPKINLGEKCYNAFSQAQKCKACPRDKEERIACHYDNFNKCHLVLLTSEFEWQKKLVDLVVVYTSVTETKPNYSEPIKYDLLFEIDLTRKQYKLLFDSHVLIAPIKKEGSFTDLNEYVNQAVYPEDFLIARYFQQFNNTGESYRYKTVKHEYRWVNQWRLHLEVPGEDKYLYFLCDVDQITSENMNQLSEHSNSDVNFENGLMTPTQFYALCNRILVMDSHYYMVSFQVNQYEMFKAWYGPEINGNLITQVANLLKMESKAVTYTNEAGFLALFTNSEDKIQNVQDQIKKYFDQIDPNMLFVSVLGVCTEVADSRAMAEKARLAVDQYQENGADVLYFQQNQITYDNQGTKLIKDIRKGLANHEFKVYYQPKCHMRTGKVVGFEALVRWIHPEYGLIMPSEFIPILENTGLITKLDVYVWEQVVQDLVSIQGNTRLPISINVSVKDIEKMDVLQVIIDITNKYKANPEWIEIEITESVYAKNYHRMDALVRGFHAAKYKVLIDDFGSAYSSLNMLSNMSVDILKLDMKFLDFQNENEQKGLSIIDAVVKMAHWMGLTVIGEGVENERQRDYLLSVGCEYGQGFYYYAAISYEQMVEMLNDPSKIDQRGIVSERMNTIQPSEFFNPYFVNDVTLNKILGAVAFFEETQGHLSVSQVNDEYYQVTATNPIDFKNNSEDTIQYIHEEDRDTLLKSVMEAKKHPMKGSDTIVRHKKGDQMFPLHFKIFYLQSREATNYYFAKLERINHD